MSDNLTSDNNDLQDTLRFEEYLSDLKDFIFAEYEPKDVTVYRWSHSPMIDDDDLPQIFQESDPHSVDDMIKPKPDDPDYVKRSYVSRFSYSCFIAQKSAEDRFCEIWNKMKTKNRDRFVNQKGGYIVKLNITKDKALMDKTQDNGHTQILLREGVHIQNLVDKSFTPVKIKLDDES
jgi:hypothetical protein